VSFEVKIDVLPVKIVARHPATGEECVLVHHVREPLTSEWVEYHRRDAGAEIKRNRLKWEPKTLEAAEWLYDKIVKKTEGYTKDGVDIMISDDFRSLVPVLHKQTVVRRFGEIWEDEEQTKN